MITDIRDARAAQKQRDQQFEPFFSEVTAVIIAVDGSTSPAGQPNKTWISEFNNSQSQAWAWNFTTLAEAGTPVWVGRRNKPPYDREIIRGYFGSVSPSEETNLGPFTLPSHAGNHQYPSEANPGPDVVKVYQPALQMLKTTGNGSNLTVATQPLIYEVNGRYKTFAGTSTDLTSYLPATAGQARRVLLYLDTATGGMGVVQGTAVAVALPVSYPAIPDGAIPSAHIYLANGQTAVSTASHIADARPFLNPKAEFTPTAVGQVLMSIDGVTFAPQSPLTSGAGWLVNEDGLLLVSG